MSGPARALAGLLAALLVAACGDDPSSAGTGTAAGGSGDGSEDTRADDTSAGPDATSEDTGAVPDTPLAPDTASDTAGGAEDTGGTTTPDAGPPADPGSTGACPPGSACDDGALCTFDDRCGDDGETCAGTPYSCDDGRSCTDDTCDGAGDCRFVVAPGSCLIANVCYVSGASHSENRCVACDPAVSSTEWALAAQGTPCGDDDPCLADGTCDGGQCSGAAVSCDDGNPCTDDRCDISAGCVTEPNFDACDDGDPCTDGDTCYKGSCKTGLIVVLCDDHNPCTLDICGASGCLHTNHKGACTDGNACTQDDRCDGGACVPGAPLNCADGNNCTEDTCNPWYGCDHALVDNPCCSVGANICDDDDPCTTDLCNQADQSCSYVSNNASCDDGDACSGPDQCTDGLCSGPFLDCDDGNPCTADNCLPGLGCSHDNLTGNCDDGTACTKDDKCIGGTCTGQPLSCNDQDSCTADACDPAVGCTHAPKVGPCDDGNLCTKGTACTPTGCKGVPITCDDQNPCTNDSCHPAIGCQHQAVAGTCDDGQSCSTGDHCEGGFCTADTSQCGCQPTFGDVVTKMTVFHLGTNGHPGQGLDLDGNAATCNPATDCSAGIDNVMATFAAFANESMDGAVIQGDVVLVLEHVGFNTTGTPYQLNFYVADTKLGSTCDYQTQSCEYEVKKDSMNLTTCKPLYGYDNAKVQNGKLTAGGKGYTFPFSLPLGDAVLQIALFDVTFQADVTVAGGKITSMKGIMAGALPKEKIIEGIDAAPDEGFPAGLDKETIKSLIGLLIVNDIDIDGNGSKDAASVGLVFEAIPGKLIGLD